ncbi:MAG: 6-bladed beta-propeller, partial [bacterium]
GTGNGEFSQPWGIAVNKVPHQLYVVDSLNYRVQKFQIN